MYRQVNSPKEIMKRLAYLAYVASIMAFFVGIVVSMGRPTVGHLILAVSSFICMACIRYVGYRWLDFERLFESFPVGCARDAVPEPIRTEVECLVDEFHAPETDWVRRSQIRHRLIELEEQQPEIIEAYSEDLSRVLAA